MCKVLQQTGLRLNFSAPSLSKRLSCKVHKDWKTQVGPNDEVRSLVAKFTSNGHKEA